MNTNIINKICLGTAQFGMDYGIANKHGKIKTQQAEEIINYAYGSGIRFLDTAYAYGDSEKIIGNYLEKSKDSLNIITKISSKDALENPNIKDTFAKSLNNLKVSNIYGLLIHDFSGFQDNMHIWEDLSNIRKEGKIGKIGFSLYLPRELEFLLKNNIALNIVQVPYSILDRRFEPYFETLKNQGIEIQIRSVFLQGLVYLDPNSLTGNLVTADKPLEQLREIAMSNDIPIGAICLNYVLLNSLVDKVVLGVDSLAHLKDDIANFDFMDKVLKIKSALNTIAIEDENVLLPYRWENK